MLVSNTFKSCLMRDVVSSFKVMEHTTLNPLFNGFQVTSIKRTACYLPRLVGLGETGKRCLAAVFRRWQLGAAQGQLPCPGSRNQCMDVWILSQTAQTLLWRIHNMFRKQYAIFMLGVLLPLLTTLITGCSGGVGSGGNDVCANAEYWVSTSGDDASETGSYGAPFKTIDRARLAAQNNPLKGQCTINVNIESGTYTLQQPVIFSSLDSGTAQHNVVYRAASDNTAPAVISGGMQVSGFSCSSANLCTADVTALPNGIMPRQFYVGGQRAIRARSNYGESVNLDYLREPTGYAQIFPQTLTHPELVEAVTVTQWKMMRCPVASQSGTHLAMQNPCWNNANTYPSPWNFQLLSWLENAPEFLTQPNMWYLDGKCGVAGTGEVGDAGRRTW
jgi:hypothetical protein